MFEVREALRRELRLVLCGAEQRFEEGVVIADARAGVGGTQADSVHRRQDRGGLERCAAILWEHGLVV